MTVTEMLPPERVVGSFLPAAAAQAARVEKVDVRWRSYVGDFSEFRITD